MDQEFYKVIYTGILKNGIDINSAAAEFAVKFKKSSEYSLNILQINKELNLITKTEYHKAIEFKSILEDLGLIVRIEKNSNTHSNQPNHKIQEKIEELTNLNKSDLNNTRGLKKKG